jgi:hypothetical protein
MQSSSEREPLLVPPDRGAQVQDAARRKSQRKRSILSVIGITIASLVFALLLFAALLVHSFIPSDQDLQTVADGAVVVHPSPDIQVLNFTRSYTTGFVQVSGEAGIDALQILGIGADGAQDRGHGAAWWESLRWSLGQRAVQFAGPLVAQLPQAITIYPHGSSKPLLNVTLSEPIDIPLIVRNSKIPLGDVHDADWLHPFTHDIRVDLLSHTDLVGFATKAWARGAVTVDVVIPEVQVRSRTGKGWRRWLNVKQKDVCITRRMEGKSVIFRFLFVPSPSRTDADMSNPRSPLLHNERHQASLRLLVVLALNTKGLTTLSA